MMMNTTKKMIEDSIMLAIAELTDDIQNGHVKSNEAVWGYAQAIKTLAEAYDIVHRGKRGEC